MPRSTKNVSGFCCIALILLARRGSYRFTYYSRNRI
jgi:hypothetical protein